MHVRMPLLCDFRLQGRNCGAGVCAWQETDSQRVEVGLKRQRGRGKRWSMEWDEEEKMTLMC